MTSLVWAAVLWVALFAASMVAAKAHGLDYWQALGLFVPVSLLWGLWAAGYLLAPRRRPGVLSALARLSARLRGLRG